MNQIKAGAAISYLALFLNIAIGLVYTPWMIRSIGKADYGLFTLAMSVIHLFVFDFGLGSAVTRYVSKFLAEGRQDKVDQLLGVVSKLYLIGDCIILIGLAIVYFLLPNVYQGLTPEEMEKFKTIYIIASLFCLISFPFIPLNGVLTSYEKFVPLKLCDLSHKIIIVVMMTACLLLGYGLFALVIVNSLAGIIIILFKLKVLGWPRIKAIQWRFWDKQMIRSILSFSIWVTIVLLAQRFIFNIAPSILAFYATSALITILGLAIALEGYTYSFASAINGMFFPRVSRMVQNGQRDDILSLMIRVGRIQIVIIGLICVGFIAVGRSFINAWLGDGFEDVYICALMLILPSFFHLPQEIGNNALYAENKVKLQAIVFVCTAVLNITLGFPLTKFFGVKGLCFSIMAASLFRTISMDVIFYKNLNINIFRFFKDSFLKMLPFILLSLALSYLAISFVPLAGWTGVAVKAIICMAIYISIMWFTAMNNEEKALIINPVKRIFHR